MGEREPKAVRVRAIRAANGRIQGWAVEQFEGSRWWELRYIRQHRHAMNWAHHYARAVTHA